MMKLSFEDMKKKIEETNFNHMEGIVKNIIGLTIEVNGVKAVSYTHLLKKYLQKLMICLIRDYIMSGMKLRW